MTFHMVNTFRGSWSESRDWLDIVKSVTQRHHITLSGITCKTLDENLFVVEQTHSVAMCCLNAAN